jgi:hypothetical protein
VQRIHQGDGTRAHGENVPNDAAYAGGGALVRLNERGMVVGFDLEDRCETFTYVHNAGVFAGALDHLRAFGGKFPQMYARALVTAVLRPHDRKDSKLGDVWLPSQDFYNAVVFFFGEIVLFKQIGSRHIEKSLIHHKGTKNTKNP